jgi:capsule polysaccharide export protein KpsC/LpsZ/FMN phosphatase YigB (HAD superfamily)
MSLNLIPTFVFGSVKHPHLFSEWLPQRKLIFLPHKITPAQFSNDWSKMIEHMPNAEIMIYNGRAHQYLLRFAKQHKIKISYLGLGFMQELMGYDINQAPFSFFLDTKNHPYDAASPSVLERVLAQHDFNKNPRWLPFAKMMRYLLLQKIGVQSECESLDFEQEKIIVFGQHDFDLTLKFEAEHGLKTEVFIKNIISKHPEAKIYYLPALQELLTSQFSEKKDFLNQMDVDVLDPHQHWGVTLLQCCCAYTISSTMGLYALMAGIELNIMGQPFYAGWGMSVDHQHIARRQRQLTIDELLAGALIVYSRYHDPVSQRKMTPAQALQSVYHQQAWGAVLDTLHEDRSINTAMLRYDSTFEHGVGSVMVKLQKVFITSDLLMTKESEQFSNLRWMSELLTFPIKEATGLRPIRMTSSLSRTDMFSRIRFFEMSGIKLDISQTQFYFDDTQINEQSLSYLSQFVPSDALIIGYELSEQTRRLLTKINVKYIDIWLHPIRFLDDILFGFSSNDDSIFAAIKKFEINEKLYELYATRFKIQSYKGYKRIDFPVAENSALFIGQTLEDKAVCRKGKMLNLLDFKKRFEELGAKFSTIYYSRHPYVKSGDEDILAYLATQPFAKIVDWPAYQVLSHNNLKYVFSVSSSVVFEARAFGKKADFLFQPVINLSNQFGIRSYISIYQEFVSPHFWSQVLGSIFKVDEDAPRLMYLEGKDKLRDMLAFYWSYRHIDKTESMRMQLNAVDGGFQKLNKQVQLEKKKISAPLAVLAPVKRIDPQAEYQRVVDRMHSVDVVSFDVFDTLLLRPFAKPDDLFIYMQPLVNSITDRLPDFRAARLEARKHVPRNQYAGEEVPLLARYQALGQQYLLTDEQVQVLHQLELDMEERLITVRHYGQQLLEAALQLDKTVVIVSDTFFTQQFVRKLLTKNGIKGYHKLYTSSKMKLLKATGNLYPKVLDDLNVVANHVLHVGDNHAVDVKNAEAKGIQAQYLPATVKTLEQQTLLSGQIHHDHPIARSLHIGLLANRLADDPFGLSTPSYVNAKMSDFGYCLYGPMLFDFASWVLRQAKADGVEHLFFLARDGQIVKKACDLLIETVAHPPKSTYLYASRRGINVPAMLQLDDVLALLSVNFAPMTLGALLEQRFGIERDQVAPMIYQQHGFSAPDQVVRFKDDKEKLQLFISDIAPMILENAAEERHALLAYFEQQGLFQREQKKAVVDIGHNGTMQQSLCRLADDDVLAGYYFATYDGIKALHDKGLIARGYAADAIDPKNKNHPYMKHILMFELLFLNDQGSFVRMFQRDGQFEPKLLPTDGEESRMAMIRQVHKGALAFVRDVLGVLGAQATDEIFSPEAVLQPYSAFLSNPALLDVELFDQVVFENLYSGRDYRPVVSANDVHSPIWVEGSALLKLHQATKQ